jgi:dihydrodipicolinate synthase/N-acetylneuraminate lyase
MTNHPMPDSAILEKLRHGVAIPAHPLALTPARKLDERRQRALTRYYLAAGVGGVAVGVHGTQFKIRDASIGLLQPVLELATETVERYASAAADPVILVAGICGPTPQAVREAELARSLGYHLGLLSLAALRDADDHQLLEHCRAVAEVMPLFGFYLQPSVGGRILPYSFWRRFAEIQNVVAIKMAPFNRYQTLDVVRAVIDAGRGGEIALYTGNDDAIVYDLLTPWNCGGETVRIVGGLLGHWAVWTRRAVQLLEDCRRLSQSDEAVPARMLTLAAQVTDANAAFFDPAHEFAGCIAGIHEVLVRQGLMAGRWCLDPHEDLSPGQLEEIDRVYVAYPHLHDDDFVRAHLDEWLG